VTAILVDMDDCIVKVAKVYDIPPDVIRGIVAFESGGQWAARTYVYDHKHLFDPNDGHPWRTLTMEQYCSDEPAEDFDGLVTVTEPDEEWIGQKTKWGPMQILGNITRELGFTGKFQELMGSAGVRFGVAHLRRLMNEGRSLDEAIAAYGANCPTPKGISYLEQVKSWKKE